MFWIGFSVSNVVESLVLDDGIVVSKQVVLQFIINMGLSLENQGQACNCL